ncbi:phage terminase large subunit family protein [Brevibacillus centrosporus]|uniref:phage terminase large subunit family protein n=2 Tax=Brevibacillus centrosporus TaxID=54910 RepID=UPI000F09BD44|nr:phage terminase large subunit family protein [Brevibacillus centrosporus]MEC2130390.1 phage terminase large subunit family protein [Brevibacillus centrosporus]RNB64042.1 phage terminase large subunit family protein [Brevibacillus centrosporus]
MVVQKTVDLFVRANKQWEPKRRLTVSEWADMNRVLTTESSAEAGPWRTDRAPYQREIMDSIEKWEEVAIMASAQVGKTEFLLNVTGSYIDQEPCPIMHVLPNEDLIQAYSKKRLTPMINSSDVLRNKIGVAKSRDSGNTIEEKSFPGGYVTIVGANAPAGLSSRPVQIVLCDEVDRFPISSGKEGDPISLAIARTKTFRHKRRHLFVSTPVEKETSRIYQLYEDSTMEQWCLPCPHCGELQPLRFKNGIVYEHYVSESGEIVVTKADHRCAYCGMLGSEKEWKRGEGKWIARKQHSSRRGFHINQLSSPWSDWREVAKAFLVAKREGIDKLKVFVNTVLGEPWETKEKGVNEKTLAARRERYAYEVPAEVKVITAAVDTQDDRFEIEVRGWGAGKESWGIEYHRIYGNLDKPEIWKQLDEFLCRSWLGENGREYRIIGACIDSGGHFTKEVYEFTRARNYRHIYAIKGQGISPKTAKQVPFIYKKSKTQLEGAVLWMLGVDDGKVKVFDSLNVQEPGPLYCHFPGEDKGYTEEYFLGLTAEAPVYQTIGGRKYKTWKKIRDRNEPFDLAVYNRAVIEILRPNLSLPIERQPNGPKVMPGGTVVGKKRRKQGVSSSI